LKVIPRIMFILSLCILSGYGFARSAFSDVNADSLQALGLHFGNVSGNGLSYRYFFDNIGLQAVLGGYNSGVNSFSFPDQIMKTESESVASFTKVDRGRKYSLNLGINAIFTLKRTDSFIFYLAGGLCWKYYNETIYKQNYTLSEDSVKYLPSGTVSNDKDVSNLLNMGFGPGVQLPLGKYFKLSIEIPVTYTGRHQFIMYVPQVGVYYYFK